jgi:hypothetical protein
MGVLEVEHAVDRTGDAVQRSAADARQRPVVLDERRIEVWSVTLWSTRFCREGEGTSNGKRGP